MPIFNCRKITPTDDGFTHLVSFDRKSNGASHYDRYMQAIGNISHKRMNFETREWYIDDKGYDTIQYYEQKYAPAASKRKAVIPKRITKNADKGKESKLVSSMVASGRKEVTGYEGAGSSLKLKPYPYQQEVIKYCKEAKECLIVAPCGAGKTPILIGLYSDLRKEGKITGPGLIVVKASLKTQWEAEVKKFSDFRPIVVKTFSSCGSNYDRFMKQFKDVDLFILNYETLNDEHVRGALHAAGVECVLCDEIQFVKSDTAKRSKSLYEFNDAPYKFGATATPVQRDPRDLYGIYKFVNPTLFPKKGEFGHMFIIWNSYGRVGGSKNEKLLNKKISPYMILKTEEEVAKQLPRLVVTERHCSFAPKQQALSDKLMDELDALHDKEEMLLNGLTEKERAMDPELQKVEAGIMMRQTALQELADSEQLLEESSSEAMRRYTTGTKKSSKLELLVDVASEIVDSGKKVAIFSKYAAMQKIITERFQKDPILKETKIAYINGALSDTQRYEEVYEKFSKNDEYGVLLLSDAGAEGLNLSTCGYLIEYEPATSYAIQTQRHGRIKRADSAYRTAHVIQLICDNSYDEIAQKIVSKKERYDSTIIRGQEKEFEY